MAVLTRDAGGDGAHVLGLSQSATDHCQLCPNGQTRRSRMIVPLITLFALLGSGIAVFLAIGLTAATMMLSDGHTIGGIAQIVVDRFNSSTLTAIPFFVIAATSMRRGGIANTLVDAAQAWIGGVRGGLAF
ncbi:MAG: TRAP transporter large permease subunit, partial [Alphaproteobacteria bacterium]|nr:TRAP transporter large permease subunit [Alphaproteobacteria bacterium]